MPRVPPPGQHLPISRAKRKPRKCSCGCGKWVSYETELRHLRLHAPARVLAQQLDRPPPIRSKSRLPYPTMLSGDEADDEDGSDGDPCRSNEEGDGVFGSCSRGGTELVDEPMPVDLGMADLNAERPPVDDAPIDPQLLIYSFTPIVSQSDSDIEPSRIGARDDAALPENPPSDGELDADINEDLQAPGCSSPLLPIPLETVEPPQELDLSLDVHANQLLRGHRAVRQSGIDAADWQCIRAFIVRRNTRQGDNAYGQWRLFFPEFNLPSLKIIRRRVTQLSGVVYKKYDCCPRSCCCFAGDLAGAVACPYCGHPRLDSGGQPFAVFCYVPLIPQLRALYAGLNSSKEMRYRSENHYGARPGHVQDVYDSELYRECVRKHIFVDGRRLRQKYFEDPRDVFVSASTDGFGIFKRGNYTTWPLQIMNNNLPPDTRCHIDNVLCLGTIPGPKQPQDFDSFWFPFVDEMLQLSRGCVAYDAFSDSIFTLRAFLIEGLGDILAVAKAFMRMKGPNSFSPCRACPIQAVRSNIIGDAKTLYVPIQRPPRYPPSSCSDPANLPFRTHDEFVSQAREVSDATVKVTYDALSMRYGIKGLPLLATLPTIDFPRSFPYDFMHILEDVIEHMIMLWTGEKKLDENADDYIIPGRVWKDIARATTLATSTMPSAFGRPIHDMSESRTFWTAESYVIWFTLYAPIVLHDRFSDPKYYNHACKLIKLINLTLSYDLSGIDLASLERGYVEWYQEYERLYYRYHPSRLSLCPLIMHGLLHIAPGIRQAGPAWCTWCYAMERQCCDLGRAVRSRQHPFASLNWAIIEGAIVKALINRYDLQNRIPSKRRVYLRSDPNAEFTLVGDEDYEGYTLLRPQKFIEASDSLRSRIANFLSLYYNADRNKIKKLVPTTLEQWAKVKIGGEGDMYRSQKGIEVKLRKYRDATFVQYEQQVDKYAHRRHRTPDFEPRTFYGRVDRVIVIAVPTNHTLKILEPKTFILADIHSVKHENVPAVDLVRFKDWGPHEIVNVPCIHAVVGRIFDRNWWYIVSRPGGIRHAQFVADGGVPMDDFNDGDRGAEPANESEQDS